MVSNRIERRRDASLADGPGNDTRVVRVQATFTRFFSAAADCWRNAGIRRSFEPFDRFVRYYDFGGIDRAVHDSAVTGEVVKPILRMPD